MEKYFLIEKINENNRFLSLVKSDNFLVPEPLIDYEGLSISDLNDYLSIQRKTIDGLAELLVVVFGMDASVDTTEISENYYDGIYNQNSL